MIDAFLDLDELLGLSDFVSIHSPLTPQTFHLIDDRRLSLMKPTAFLINTARGAIVDQEALIRCLIDRRIAGAGLDVFEKEPPPADCPLFGLDNVILTPHCAAHTALATEKVRNGAIEAIFAALRGLRPAHVVNPEVFEPGEERHRRIS